MSVGGIGIMEYVKLGAGAAIGGIATRKLTQVVLQDSNTGIQGYAANFGVAAALTLVAAKFFKSPRLAEGIAAGGVSATIMRILADQFPNSSVLSGVGDPLFSDDGLGGYIDSGFPVPTVSSNNGNYLAVGGPASGAPAGVVVPPASAGSAAPGVASIARFSRWN